MPTFKMKGKKPSHYYNAKQGIIPPLICMEQTAWIKDADDDSVAVFKLRSNPSDPKSQIYGMKARSFSTGSVKMSSLLGDLEYVRTCPMREVIEEVMI